MDKPEFLPTDQAIDLTNCDREPIHLLGRVQSFGCLICVSSDWIVVHASENTAAILGLDAERLIGMPFGEFFPDETVHAVRARLQGHTQDSGPERLFGLAAFDDSRRYDVSLQESGRHFLVEFEPAEEKQNETGNDYVSTVRTLIRRVQRQETIEKAATEAARGLKHLTGFDRVMVYRFEPDLSGTVIAERAEQGLESYLGLRYPASDIPKQARELYTRSLLRIIADVNDTPSAIVPETSPAGDPLDLSLAVTRAVSPIHLEYLRNMGVEASMSVSILREGQLWGLFACHHYAPHYLGFEKRSALELFSQMFNYELTQSELKIHVQETERARALHDRLMSRVSSGHDLLESFDVLAPEIGEVIACDGMAIYSNGRYDARGLTPTKDEFLGLARFLNTAHTSQVFSTDNIGERYEDAESFADRVAGLLAIPISRKPRDYLVLFRQEISRTVRWAGNPEKPVELGPHGARLTPRKSFDEWREVVRGTSEPWKSNDLRAAEALRVTLLEVVLKLSDEASEQRKRAQNRQELLIAELNHRVRNILSLIRALVSQSRQGAETLEEYSKTLNERINALARAHDQLTDHDWGWTPLREILENEVRAFVSEKTERVVIDGDELQLSPTAFTTLALVLHELVTNSAKYGALSDSSGSVELTASLDPDGTAKLSWREKNGPPVKVPTRSGFGSIIIEHSVRHDLKGDSDVRYRLTGLEADFQIPAAHVSRADEIAMSTAEPEATDGHPDAGLVGHVLLVEDNLIITMDTTDILTDLGATHVHTASSVATAVHALSTKEITFALIDINLGDENSFPVIEDCIARGISVVLATGYGANKEVTERFPGIPVMQKPYSSEDIVKALATL
ncbi:MAG: GAF domain-containing protein [Alphaproteobacteria bacterium]|nr:GAF domain-containing protein [Alphaproteobacteria bacterium]